MKKKPVKLYNFFLPIWLLVWWPSVLWLILIPLNYLLDYFVLYISLKGYEDRKPFCRKQTWKICLAGFFADFVGSMLLLGIVLLSDRAMGTAEHGFLWDFSSAIASNAFEFPPALLVTLIAIFLAAVIIYFLDRRILRKTGLSESQAGKAARYLAIITAPYLFLIPMTVIYGPDYW